MSIAQTTSSTLKTDRFRFCEIKDRKPIFEAKEPLHQHRMGWRSNPKPPLHLPNLRIPNPQQLFLSCTQSRPTNRLAIAPVFL